MALQSGGKKTMADLELVHEDYAANIIEWRFLTAAYEGIEALVAWGVIERHERESVYNWKQRVKKAFGFSYSKSVVDLFNLYLFKKPVKRQLGALAEDQQWIMFNRDCDLYQEDFDSFLIEQSKWASAIGHVGILVDKSKKEHETKAQEIDNRVYPYVSAYLPQAVLDWEYDRDENNRPVLTYLKLFDEDEQYRLWWADKWEVYAEPEETEEEKKLRLKQVSQPKPAQAGTQDAKLIDSGDNPLGEIPFVWLLNKKSRSRNVGWSDIGDIAHIDASIILNLSQGEEIINYAAFPMMRKPKEEIGDEQTSDETGVVAVLEFDPDTPEAKPDWLKAEASEPILAILKWIGKKVEEIYRMSNAGGMAATEIQTQARSGVALKTEFQLLNSILVKKGKNMEKAEWHITRLWLLWQNDKTTIKEITIERAKTYEVQDLAQDLENIMTSKTIIKSTEYIRTIMKKAARLMLPSATDDELVTIDKEIDEYDPTEVTEFIRGGIEDGSKGPPGAKEGEEEEED